jgi:predicted outer membrane protein
MKRIALLLIASLLMTAAGALYAEEESSENAVKKTAKRMGHDAKKAGKEVAKAAKKVGKDIGHGTTKAAKTIKKEFKEDFVDRKNDDPPPHKTQDARTPPRKN